jgi:hypothetical protein
MYRHAAPRTIRAGNTGTIPATLKRALLVVALLVALPYARSRVYRFPAPVAFSGAHFLNPYADLKGQWLRANFHAHGRAWSGLTSGQQTDEDVVQAYRNLGYAVAGISNYEHISATLGADSLPIYEHGYNIGKRHQLAIGARRVEWFDFPFWQSTSHEQLVIDLVRQRAELVALAHPSVRNAYSTGNLERLTGYELVEVVNGQFADAAPWDAALSSGHAVWGLANDDGHDITDPLRMAIAWNMVNAPSASAADMIDALRAGHAYSVLRLNTHPEAEITELTGVEFKDRTLTITCTGAPSDFAFTGQNGTLRTIAPNTLTGSFTFAESDTYIRATIWSPRRMIFLNPIVRYDGVRLPTPVASVNRAATWLIRLAFVAVAAICVLVERGQA